MQESQATDTVKRDWSRTDPASGLPYCYGNSDPRSNTCMTCDFEMVCTGASRAVSVIAPVAGDEDPMLDNLLAALEEDENEEVEVET